MIVNVNVFICFVSSLKKILLHYVIKSINFEDDLLSDIQKKLREFSSIELNYVKLHSNFFATDAKSKRRVMDSFTM